MAKEDVWRCILLVPIGLKSKNVPNRGDVFTQGVLSTKKPKLNESIRRKKPQIMKLLDRDQRCCQLFGFSATQKSTICKFLTITTRKIS